MKKMITAIACMLVLALCLTACGQVSPEANLVQSLANGGVLVLRVNPEIAVEYDAEGVVTGVTARNDDALTIINSCTGLIGQPARNVVSDLVTAIGEAGYFVEEIDGSRRHITLEIESGSSLPSDTFLEDVVADVRNTVNNHDWSAPLEVDGESDFGITEYVDTDYGPDNDGVTDFGKTDYNDTDYGPDNDGVTDFGKTDYNDTDYGPDNDGVTDFGKTDYNDTDYGPDNDGVTDFGKTDYHDGKTDYDKETNYGDSKYD